MCGTSAEVRRACQASAHLNSISKALSLPRSYLVALKQLHTAFRRERYAQRHLEHSDYYDEHRRVQGEWHGRGAELLGLHGEVKQEQFEAVREGLHPETGEFLRPRHSADRMGVDGNEQSKGRSLYDLTFSAPKSVSIQALVGRDERLIAAHDKAVREALAGDREPCCHTRSLERRKRKSNNGKLVVASYRHDTSRELDPQLHTHAVAANLTYDGVEGRWKALQASGLYERRAYLTEVYRNTLAHEVRSLGYEIETRRDSRGRDLGFEIRGVSDDLLERYSQRSAQRDRAIDEFTKQNGRKPTDNEVAVLVRETRADKLAEISTEQVRQQQQARLSPEEQRNLEQLRHNSLEHRQNVPDEISRAQDSLQYAKEHLFERRSVVHDYELLAEALQHGRGHVDLGQLRGLLQVEQSQGELIHAGNRLATRESLDREQRMVALVDKASTSTRDWVEHMSSAQMNISETNKNAQFSRFLIHAISPSTCVEQPEPVKRPRFRKLIAGFAKPAAM